MEVVFIGGFGVESSGGVLLHYRNPEPLKVAMRQNVSISFLVEFVVARQAERQIAKEKKAPSDRRSLLKRRQSSRPFRRRTSCALSIRSAGKAASEGFEQCHVACNLHLATLNRSGWIVFATHDPQPEFGRHRHTDRGVAEMALLHGQTLIMDSQP
jgi:hypothetical protein